MAQPAKVATQPQQVLSGLARQLVNFKVIDEKTALAASVQSLKTKKSLIHILVDNKLAGSSALAVILSEQFGVPLFDVSALNIEKAPKDVISSKLLNQYRILPLWRRGNKIFVGVSDPTVQQVVTDVQFATGLICETVLIEDAKIDKILLKISQDDDMSGGDAGVDFEAVDDDAGAVTAADADDEKVVGFVNKMLLDAIKGGSSDLHFEPYEKAYRVRFRTDGMLHEVSRPPLSMANRISARLKVMCSMDISERRKPQDGRLKLKLSASKAIDFRVNTCPTLWGEKIVLRILDPSSAQMGIDALGYEDNQKQLYLDALAKPQGMVLVTGPTGSGKTVSLYTGVNILNTPDVNISTAEDPVEINLEGVNQVNVNPKQGMTFEYALKAFLRQDPDVILVGEIRDLETASIAVKAAQTGHMVMSTLHTNSCAETITRMRNMGLQSFAIATSVNLIIAQRLARRLCKECKRVIDIPKETLLKEGFQPDEIGTFEVYEPVGCDNCKGGYKGRVGIYEVVKITPPLQKIIMEEGNSIVIAETMRKEGFNDLRRSGLMKAKQGLTSLAEVNRVTSE